MLMKTAHIVRIWKWRTTGTTSSLVQHMRQPEWKELEAIVLKYNIRPDPYGLTFPPQKSANEVYNAILEYVKATGYWSII